jgi:hypothetical protein
LDEALAITELAVAESQQTAHPWWGATAAAAFGNALIAAHRAPEAVPVLESAAREAAYEGAEMYLLRCLAPIAEATGSEEVLVDVDALLGRLRVPDGCALLTAADAYLSTARAWLGLNRADRARDVLAPLLRAAARVPWVGVLAAAQDVDATAAAALLR